MTNQETQKYIVKNLFDKKVTLTEMEYLVYKILRSSDTLEDAFCHCPEEIHYQSGLEMKKLRGVLSSLIKKEVAYAQKWNGKDIWIFLWETPEGF